MDNSKKQKFDSMQRTIDKLEKMYGKGAVIPAKPLSPEHEKIQQKNKEVILARRRWGELRFSKINTEFWDKENFELMLNHKDTLLTAHYGYLEDGHPYYKGEKHSKPHRYTIFAKGNFYKDEINYGFDLNRASDKAYLVNDFEDYANYLESKIYANKVDKTDYLSLEGYSFQGFRADDKKNKAPLVFPRVKVQKVIAVDDAEAVEKHGLLIVRLPKIDKDRNVKVRVKSI